MSLTPIELPKILPSTQAVFFFTDNPNTLNLFPVAKIEVPSHFTLPALRAALIEKGYREIKPVEFL